MRRESCRSKKIAKENAYASHIWEWRPTQRELIVSLAARLSVARWPKAGIPSCTAHVRFRG